MNSSKVELGRLFDWILQGIRKMNDKPSTNSNQYKPKALSERHIAILRQVCLGRSYDSISEEFEVSKSTISRVLHSESGREYTNDLCDRLDQMAINYAAITGLEHQLRKQFPLAFGR